MRLEGQTGKRFGLVKHLAVLWVALTVTSIATWLKRFELHEGDLHLYYKYSLNVLQGQMPYRDFPLEYPPLALLPMVLPQLANLGFGFHGYIILFLLQNILITTLIALLLLRVTSYYQLRQRSSKVLRVYILLAVLSAPFLMWRFDLFPALLTLLALLFVILEQPAIAGVWLGLGITAKLYPVVLLPIFSAYYLASRKYRDLQWLLLGSIGATVVALLPFALIAKSEIFSFLRYHQQRGLQIESLWAGIVSLAHVFGLTKASVVINYGAFHLESPLANSIVKWLPLISILSFLGVIAFCLRSFRREYLMRGKITAESLVTYIVALLLTFIATSKVFSPQYLIWLLPFAPLIRPRQLGLIVGIFALTTLIFPGTYDRLVKMQALLVLVLNLRNLFVVVLLLWLLIERPPASVKPSLQQPFMMTR